MRKNPRKYNTRLQKISQTSSPSHELQDSGDSPYFFQRVNPSSLASSYLKFQKIQEQRQKQSYHNKINYQNHSSQRTSDNHQTIQDKNQKISQLQQKIINKKMHLNMLEQSFEKRFQAKGPSFIDLFCKLTNSILSTCKNDLDQKRNILKMLIKYSQKRKENQQSSIQVVFRWILGWVRQVFSLISKKLSEKTQK